MANLSELVETMEVQETKPVNNTDSGLQDLHSLLAAYKEPAKVTEVKQPEQQVKQPEQEQPKTNTAFPGAPHWYGNPLYYQSGKKQGQLKPPPKKGIFTQPNVSVNPEPIGMTADAVINGVLFLTVINLLFPMLFALVNNLIVKDKRKRMDYEHLQIPEKDLKKLEVLADKALKHIKLEANPVAIFLFAMSGMYAMQFMTVKMLTEQTIVNPKP